MIVTSLMFKLSNYFPFKKDFSQKHDTYSRGDKGLKRHVNVKGYEALSVNRDKQQDEF